MGIYCPEEGTRHAVTPETREFLFYILKLGLFVRRYLFTQSQIMWNNTLYIFVLCQKERHFNVFFPTKSQVCKDLTSNCWSLLLSSCRWLSQSHTNSLFFFFHRSIVLPPPSYLYSPSEQLFFIFHLLCFCLLPVLLSYLLLYFWTPSGLEEYASSFNTKNVQIASNIILHCYR